MCTVGDVSVVLEPVGAATLPCQTSCSGAGTVDTPLAIGADGTWMKTDSSLEWHLPRLRARSYVWDPWTRWEHGQIFLFWWERRDTRSRNDSLIEYGGSFLHLHLLGEKTDTTCHSFEDTHSRQDKKKFVHNLALGINSFPCLHYPKVFIWSVLTAVGGQQQQPALFPCSLS